MKTSSLSRQLNFAFTLVELLVVIVIIGILASIALPVMSKIRDSGDSTASVNSMRQLGTALATVAGENNFNLPLGYGNDPVLRLSRPRPTSQGYNYQMRLSDTPNMFGSTIPPRAWVKLFENKTAFKKEKYGASIDPYVGSVPYGVNAILTKNVTIYGDDINGTWSTLKLPKQSNNVILADTWINTAYTDVKTGLSSADGTFDYTKAPNTQGAISFRHPGTKAALLFGDWHIQMASKAEVDANKGVWFDPALQ